MKNQKGDKPATFHGAGFSGGKPQELHLCEDHARDYLTTSSDEPSAPNNMAAVLAQHVTQQMAVGQTAEELAELDQQSCPVCGITFYDFRNKGRLGCPYDYDCFQTQLEPLIMSIHGESDHSGKSPQRCPDGSQRRIQVIRLRREMKDAIEEEDYERASELRDRIREAEQER